MGLTQKTRADVLKSLFASGGTFYVSLHAADPGERGNQLTNEVDYVDYQRKEYPREESAWVFKGDRVTNAEMIQFPKAASEAVITHIGLGFESEGGGELMMASPLIRPLPIAPGIVTVFAAGDISFAMKSRVPVLE